MAAYLTAQDKRTCYCAELSAANIGETVCVMGWAQRQRDLGSLIFIDLRDRTGIVQLAFGETTDREIFDLAFNVRAEFVLCAHGTVRARGEGAVNKNIPTGEIEIEVTSMKVLSKSQTPPFAIVENSDVKPELRLKHRYLDLRRPDLAHNLIARSEISKIARDYYAENGFIDIETPCLIKPSPEGARDYLVPSRVHKGSFYALPQSPQLYKQLLMCAGFDRYFQIARCFRDEDLRADRQPEFTQLDTEMSFATADDVMNMHEGFIKYLIKRYFNEELNYEFIRMPYREAMERYGEAAKMDMQLEAVKVLFEKFPAMAAAIGEGYKGVDKIVMLGGDSTQLAGNIMQTTTQISEGMAQSLGIDLKSLMAGILGGKIVANAEEEAVG